MPNFLERAFRAGAFCFAALALAAAVVTILGPTSQPAFAASAARHAPVHAQAMHARAQAPTTEQHTVVCAKSGCTVSPPDCRAVPAPGIEPGYQMLVCP